MVHQIQLEDETYIKLFKLKGKIVELKNGKFIKWNSIVAAMFNLASQNEQQLIDEICKED